MENFTYGQLKERGREQKESQRLTERPGYIQFRINSKYLTLTQISQTFAKQNKISTSKMRQLILSSNKNNDFLNREDREKKGLKLIRLRNNVYWYTLYRGDIIYIPVLESSSHSSIPDTPIGRNTEVNNGENDKPIVPKAFKAEKDGGWRFVAKNGSRDYYRTLASFFPDKKPLLIRFGYSRKRSLRRKARIRGKQMKIIWDEKKKNYYPADTRKYGSDRVLLLPRDVIYHDLSNDDQKITLSGNRNQIRDTLETSRTLQRKSVVKDAGERLRNFLIGITYASSGSPQLDYGKISDQQFAEEFEKIKQLGYKALTFVPVFSQKNRNDPNINLDENYPGAPSEKDLIRMTRIARSKGLRVVIKPWICYYKPKTGDGVVGEWSGYISCDRPAWFANYGRSIMRLAEISNAHGVSVLVIGNELKQAFKQPWQIKEWIKIVTAIKNRFPALKLTYSPHTVNIRTFADEVKPLLFKFLKSLDFVAVNIWPDQVESKTAVPSVNDYRKGIEVWLRYTKELSEQTGRPILITEYGGKSRTAMKTDYWAYRNVWNKAKSQYERKKVKQHGFVDRMYDHLDKNMFAKISNSQQAQRNFYQAFNQLTHDPKYAPLLRGTIAWQWTPQISDAGVRKTYGRYYSDGFDVYGKKQVLGVIAENNKRYREKRMIVSRDSYRKRRKLASLIR